MSLDANNGDKRKATAVYKKQTKKMNVFLTLPHVPDEGSNYEFWKILDTDPKYCPCSVKMDSDITEISTLAERRFGISIQLFNCHTCHCCGLTKPFHDDPTFPADADRPFPLWHLVKGYQQAWKYRCKFVKVLGIMM